MVVLAATQYVILVSRDPAAELAPALGLWSDQVAELCKEQHPQFGDREGRIFQKGVGRPGFRWVQEVFAPLKPEPSLLPEGNCSVFKELRYIVRSVRDLRKPSWGPFGGEDGSLESGGGERLCLGAEPLLFSSSACERYNSTTLAAPDKRGKPTKVNVGPSGEPLQRSCYQVVRHFSRKGSGEDSGEVPGREEESDWSLRGNGVTFEGSPG